MSEYAIPNKLQAVDWKTIDSQSASFQAAVKAKWTSQGYVWHEDLNTKSRGWNFTWNNYTPADEALLQQLKCKYLAYSYEVAPTTGTPHLQGVIYFPQEHTKREVLCKVSSKHISLHKIYVENGTTEYCTKNGNSLAYSSGKKPMTQKEKGQTQQSEYKQAYDLATSGRVDEINPLIQIKHLSALNAIAARTRVEIPSLNKPCGIYIHGLPGTGKSRVVRDTLGSNLFDMSVVGDWNRYSNETAVLFDEFDKSHASRGRDLKIWLDTAPFIARILYGSMKIRPTVFVIVSNYSLEEVFKSDPILLKAIQRRCTVIDVQEPIFNNPEEGIIMTDTGRALRDLIIKNLLLSRH